MTWTSASALFACEFASEGARSISEAGHRPHDDRKLSMLGSYGDVLMNARVSLTGCSCGRGPTHMLGRGRSRKPTRAFRCTTRFPARAKTLKIFSSEMLHRAKEYGAVRL